MVNTLNLSKRFTLTGFVGPQYSENQGLVTVTQLTRSGLVTVRRSPRNRTVGRLAAEWKAAGRIERTSVSAGYSRSISDGGGVLGAVRLQTVHGNFRRQLTSGVGGCLSPPVTERTSRFCPSRPARVQST